MFFQANGRCLAERIDPDSSTAEHRRPEFRDLSLGRSSHRGGGDLLQRLHLRLMFQRPVEQRHKRCWNYAIEICSTAARPLLHLRFLVVLEWL